MNNQQTKLSIQEKIQFAATLTPGETVNPISDMLTDRDEIFEVIETLNQANSDMKRVNKAIKLIQETNPVFAERKTLRTTRKGCRNLLNLK